MGQSGEQAGRDGQEEDCRCDGIVGSPAGKAFGAAVGLGAERHFGSNLVEVAVAGANDAADECSQGQQLTVLATAHILGKPLQNAGAYGTIAAEVVAHGVAPFWLCNQEPTIECQPPRLKLSGTE
jgi:hypothetical protein